MNTNYNRRYLKAVESIAASLKTIAEKPPLTVTLELPLTYDEEEEDES